MISQGTPSGLVSAGRSRGGWQPVRTVASPLKAGLRQRIVAGLTLLVAGGYVLGPSGCTKCVIPNVFGRSAGSFLDENGPARPLEVHPYVEKQPCMAGVILEGVSRIFTGPVTALDDVSFKVEEGELLTLVGPSGSGKTTLLRLVAGLEEVTRGEIRIGGRSMRGIAPKHRGVSLVFQSYALYPHMSVRKNLAFGLKLRSGLGWWPKQRAERRKEIDEQVRKTAKLLEIEGLLDRRPAELSGGQRQRVALGRALVTRPDVYLLDEPLSNLDARLRFGLRQELKEIHRRLSATMIYVTHDQEEALALGDRVAVLDRGRLQQLGTPQVVYERPENRFVAGFLGATQMNFVRGRLEAGDPPRFAALGWSVALDKSVPARVQTYVGREVELGVRPEDVTVSPVGDVGGVPARVLDVSLLGEAALVKLQVETEFAAARAAGVALMARVSARDRMAGGELVSMHLDIRQAHLFDPLTGENVSLPRVVQGN